MLGGQETVSVPSTHPDPLPTRCDPCPGQKLRSGNGSIRMGTGETPQEREGSSAQARVRTQGLCWWWPLLAMMIAGGSVNRAGVLHMSK